MKNYKISRRAFLGSCGTALATTAIARFPSIAYSTMVREKQHVIQPICAFTRVFDFLGDDMFPLLADAGFDGVDLTVRHQGFVSPGNVEKELAMAVSKAQNAGLTIPMIATDIQQVADPLTERVIKAASGLGIRHYRMAYYRYDDKISIEQNLSRFREDMLELCEMNAKYNMQGNYQNHVGGMFGSPVWDLYEVIKEMDVRYMACQYDVRHAVAEGLSSWKLALKAISPHIGTLCMKDFIYKSEKNKWGVQSVPLTTGAVDFKAFSRILEENNISVPVSYHCEFPLYDEKGTTLTNKEKMQHMLPPLRDELARIKEIIE